MRILHVSSLYPPIAYGGAEKVAASLAEAQVRAGHEVYACSITPAPHPVGERVGVITCPVAGRNPLWIEMVSHYPAIVRLLNKAATVYNPVTAAQFGQLLDEIRPDVVHSHSLVAWPPSIWEKAAQRGIAVVHTLHDYDLLCIRATLFKDGQACVNRHLACKLLSARKRAFHDRISLVVAVSQTVLDIHLGHGLFAHLPADRRQVIWNPVALTGGPARASRGHQNDQVRFGYLGRLVEEKGLGTLIDAARRLAPGGWTLTIAGEGPDRARYEAQAAGLPIRFVGRVEPTAFLADIDVLVCVPLWDEPFGLTTLEAYAAGCRVIGDERGFIGEAVRAIDPGWTVAAGDCAQLALRMEQAAQQAGAPLPAPADVARFFSQLQIDAVAQQYICSYARAIASLT